MGRYLLDLNSGRAQNPSIAGGKGAGLARLARSGYRVPATFIIPTTAFRKLQSRICRESLPFAGDITPERLSELRKRITNTPLPSSIREAASRAFARLGGRVAVRSSMAGEDSCSASFAGQLDTVLDIEDEEQVATAVSKCLASSYNWRLWTYQRGQSLRLIRKNLSMAVVIQDMVAAKVSGVAFSANPNTGAQDVIIEAVFGLGERLVQGKVVPSRYIIDEAGALTEFPSQPGGASPLDQMEAVELAEAVRGIASSCDGHRDIEWAWDGNEFYFLQCRPVTALPGHRVYSSRLVADMSPGLVKPLLWSTKSRSMVRNVFGRICRELLGPHHIDFATFIKRIHSRTYADMTAFGEFLVKLGLPPNFFEMITRHEKSKGRRSILRSIRIPVLFRLIRFAYRHFRTDKPITEFIEAQSHRLEPFRLTNWKALAPSDLLRRFDSLMELHADTQWAVFIGPLNMTIRYRHLGRLIRGLADAANPGNLLTEAGELKALQPNVHIMAMSRLAGELEEPDLNHLLEGPAEKIEERLSKSEAGVRLLKAFQDFLARFGFLSANGSDFAAVPWNEDPTPVWRAVGRLALEPSPGIKNENTPNQELETQRIREKLRGIRRVAFERLLRSTQMYMKLRESTSLIMSEETYFMRRALMSLANHLRDEGSLREPQDIFYLYYDELRLFLDDKLPAGDIGELIVRRKDELARDAKIDPPDTIRGTEQLFRSAVTSEEFDYLEGIPGSPGRVRGTAKIVEDPREASALLSPKDILIVPFTDVGWSPLMSGIGGIVAETGGQLSHTSILAREYGLPSVVSVRDATRRIQNGQQIVLDGDLGLVYLNPEAIQGE